MNQFEWDYTSNISQSGIIVSFKFAGNVGRQPEHRLIFKFSWYSDNRDLNT